MLRATQDSFDGAECLTSATMEFGATHVSSVSGGAIVAGTLAHRWKELQFGTDGVAPTRNFFKVIVTPIWKLASRTIDVPSVLGRFFPLRRRILGAGESHVNLVFSVRGKREDCPFRGGRSPVNTHSPTEWCCLKHCRASGSGKSVKGISLR